MLDEQATVGLSYAEVDSNPFTRLYYSPNFSFKGLEVGLDLNYYFPMGDHDTPDSLNNVVVRHVAYDYQDKYGFRWGRLKNITLGQGLLVDGYDSGAGGSAEFNNNKGGILAYATFYDAKLTVMNTAESLQGLRIERPVVELASVPVIV